ncbi:MAG: hypothetical protein OEM82_04035 [Acidobacteriota bacterium]|nr:hypothetical protein [Acidobacteriota bacterium]MDH3530385.1 hypothetical protein [Acidobacteriota bacterium]
MIPEASIREVIAQYEKHGWILSRVLLSKALEESITDLSIFGGIEVTDSGLDALWFRRPRNDGYTAWEIRRLSDPPFALCETFPDSISSEEIVFSMEKMEQGLLKKAS